MGEGELAQDFTAVDLEKGPESSKHSPLPHSSWPLVPSRSRGPLADLNPRGHSPHQGTGEGLGVVLEDMNLTQATLTPTQALQASNSTGSHTQQVMPPRQAPSHYLSPWSPTFLSILSHAIYLSIQQMSVVESLLAGLSTGMQR